MLTAMRLISGLCDKKPVSICLRYGTTVAKALCLHSWQYGEAWVTRFRKYKNGKLGKLA
jgi:hypothetical protein